MPCRPRRRATRPPISTRSATRCCRPSPRGAGRRRRCLLRDHRLLGQRRPRVSSTTAQKLGLPIRLHADQLTNLHGAALAAKFGALVGRSSRVHRRGRHRGHERGRHGGRDPARCLLLPARKADAADRPMRRHGVPIAISTDCNPGSSPLTSLLLTMNMGATLFRLTVDECIAAHDARGRPRARPVRPKSAASRPARTATSRSGTSSAPPSSSTGSASILFIRGSGRASHGTDIMTRIDNSG